MRAAIRDALDTVTEVITEVFTSLHEAIAARLNALSPRRMARIEAELDRKQDELRRTVLQLADALGMEAHEARKALIRESFLASGRTPNESSDS